MLVLICMSFLLVFAGLMGAAYCSFLRSKKHWRNKGIAYKEPRFLLGSFTEVRRKNMGVIFRELYEEGKYEKLFGVWQFTMPILLVIDLELVKRVLVSDFSHFDDHGVYFNEETDPLTANLLTMGGSAWRNLRVKLNPAFTTGKLKGMFPIMLRCGEELVRVLRDPAEQQAVVEFKDLFARFTTDVISSCAFGIETNSLKDERAIFRTMGKKVFQPSWEVVWRNLIGFLFPDLAKFLKIRIYPKQLTEFFVGVIRETTSFREANNFERNDILQMLMRLENESFTSEINPDTVKKGDAFKKKEKRFTCEQIAAQAFIFFTAGFETSSTTMQYALYELAMHPDVQKKLRSEIRHVLSNKEAKLTYEALQDMPYLSRVLDETLRKYPPATNINRMCTKDYQIPGTNVILEKGTQVSVSVLGLHWDERYYPHPDVFDPDRFTEEQKVSRPPYTYIPFGEGPRTCIGQRFGLTQTKLGLICILSHYRVLVSETKTQIPPIYDPKSFFSAPAGGMFLKICLLPPAEGLNSVLGFFHVIVLFLIPVGLLSLACAYAFFKWKYSYWKKQNIRVTKPMFPLGDITEVGFAKHIGEVFKEIYDKFKGERYNGMWVIHRPYIMVRDPELIKTMFVRDFSYFRDRGLYVNEKIDPLSANLFFLGGAKWRNLRTKLSPNFSTGKMKKMFEVMSEKGTKLQKILEVPAHEKEVIEPKEFTVRYTHEVVASCILGLQAECIQNPRSIFRRVGKKIFEPSWSTIIKAAFSFLVPDLAGLLRIVATPRPVTDFFLEVVKDVMEFREKNGMESSDFMQLLVNLKNQGYLEDADVKDINGNDDPKTLGKCRFTFKNAVAQAFIFWVGGFETSATTMQFALYEMAMNVEVQDKARKEVLSVLAKTGGKVTYESLFEMNYLGRVVDETLRKYPPVSILNRVCSKNYQIPDSDVVIEEGIPVLIPVLGLHMDPDFYPEPEKFDPERFTEEAKRTRHHYAYLPFGEGPHQCLGQRFALMQIKVGLANLLANYKFETVSKTPKKPICSRKLIIYTVKDGIPLKISKLKD